MEGDIVTPRERQRLAYELAFLPERLNGMCHSWLKVPGEADPDELRALDEAALLHLPLPEGCANARAVYRLALYQAGASPYGMRTFIRNVRKRLGRPALTDSSVPKSLVADVALPHYHIPEV